MRHSFDVSQFSICLEKGTCYAAQTSIQTEIQTDQQTDRQTNRKKYQQTNIFIGAEHSCLLVSTHHLPAAGVNICSLLPVY
jgi:hypothetical protein